SVVGAVAIEEGLLSIGHLIIVVAQFVMDGREVLLVHLDTHLQAHVFIEVDIPRAGMTDRLVVCRFHKHRALPEGLWQGLKAERGEERLAVMYQLLWVSISRFENLR